MENFNLRKYLVENKLLKEGINPSELRSSVEDMVGFAESMVEINPYKLPMRITNHGWKILDLDLKDVSDFYIMEGDKIFILPSSQYDRMILRKTDDESGVDIILSTTNQTLGEFNPSRLGDLYHVGIISFKYRGKLIGRDFEKDINSTFEEYEEEGGLI